MPLSAQTRTEALQANFRKARDAASAAARAVAATKTKAEYEAALITFNAAMAARMEAYAAYRSSR